MAGVIQALAVSSPGDAHPQGLLITYSPAATRKGDLATLHLPTRLAPSQRASQTFLAQEALFLELDCGARSSSVGAAGGRRGLIGKKLTKQRCWPPPLPPEKVGCLGLCPQWDPSQASASRRALSARAERTPTPPPPGSKTEGAFLQVFQHKTLYVLIPSPDRPCL